jgi:mRNA-degrading endonuclease YafQ of YafQ-DinJ toxin-antitoxin module
MTFEELTEFNRDLKKLLKKYRTLKNDLDVVKKVLEFSPTERSPFSFRIDNLGLETCVIKIKKIACRALKGRGVNSGLRLVYAHFQEENKIIFIEIYHKNDKENEYRQRIINNFE